MPRYLLWLLLPCLLITQDANQQTKPYDVEAYEVFSTVLAMEKVKGDTLLIGDTTVPFDICLGRRSDKLADSAIENYKQANKARWRLQYRFNLDRPYRLLAEDQQRHGNKPATMEAKRIYHLSAIGFSHNRDVVFVEVDFVCGELCGHGRPYILQKKTVSGSCMIFGGRKGRRCQSSVLGPTDRFMH